jgi:hypothetical protein
MKGEGEGWDYISVSKGRRAREWGEWIEGVQKLGDDDVDVDDAIAWRYPTDRNQRMIWPKGGGMRNTTILGPG